MNSRESIRDKSAKTFINVIFTFMMMTILISNLASMSIDVCHYALISF